MTKQYLFNCGYREISDCTYEKIDKKTGMTVELEFNSKGDTQQNQEIENNIIKISTRQDF